MLSFICQRCEEFVVYACKENYEIMGFQYVFKSLYDQLISTLKCQTLNMRNRNCIKHNLKINNTIQKFQIQIYYYKIY